MKKTGCEEHLINAQVEYLRSDLTDISRMRPVLERSNSRAIGRTPFATCPG